MSKRSSEMQILANSQSIVLVGIMGVGKTHLGKRLAQALELPFIDTDQELESASGLSVKDFFEQYGEVEFRKGEKRIIERILNSTRVVMATGGGAFINPNTRTLINKHGISVWLRADKELIYNRTKDRKHRPLLNQGNAKEVLNRLIQQRTKYYQKANITFDIVNEPNAKSTKRLLETLNAYIEEFQQVASNK